MFVLNLHVNEEINFASDLQNLHFLPVHVLFTLVMKSPTTAVLSSNFTIGLLRYLIAIVGEQCVH